MPDHGGAELLEVAREVAARAGAHLLASWEALDPARDVRSKSSPTDVVTRLDVESEDIVRSLLAERRPADAVLGEEHGASAGDGRVRWVVDPLDGTVNYLYGLPTWAVSVAAEVDGIVTAAVVAAPALARTYWAAAGAGAYRDGQPLRASTCRELPVALVATGFAYDAGLRGRQGEAVGRLLGRVRDIRRLGSAALDLCLLAEGSVDAYYERGTNEWDRAAGMLVACEAGAVVDVVDGLVVGAGAQLAPSFRALLAEVDA